jgi:hypothetical protein
MKITLIFKNEVLTLVQHGPYELVSLLLIVCYIFSFKTTDTSLLKQFFDSPKERKRISEATGLF